MGKGREPRAATVSPMVSHAERWRRLEEALLRRAGRLSATVRASLATGQEIPEPFARYAEKVAHHAYRVTDEDIRALRTAGYSEDQIFEATLALAFGAANRRLHVGLDALDASGEDEGAASKGRTAEGGVNGEEG